MCECIIVYLRFQHSEKPLAEKSPPPREKSPPPVQKQDPPPPAATKEPEKKDAAKNVEDLEKELELDLENMKIDENIDTSVSMLYYTV